MTIDFSIANFTNGDYFLIFKADSDEVVTEANEADNLTTRNFKRQGGGFAWVDLAAEDLQAPTTLVIC